MGARSQFYSTCWRYQLSYGVAGGGHSMGGRTEQIRLQQHEILFLQTMVYVLNSQVFLFHVIPFPDRHFHTLYAFSRPYLRITP